MTGDDRQASSSCVFWVGARSWGDTFAAQIRGAGLADPALCLVGHSHALNGEEEANAGTKRVVHLKQPGLWATKSHDFSLVSPPPNFSFLLGCTTRAIAVVPAEMPQCRWVEMLRPLAAWAQPSALAYCSCKVGSSFRPRACGCGCLGASAVWSVDGGIIRDDF